MLVRVATLALALLMIAPAASAHHWETDNSNPGSAGVGGSGCPNKPIASSCIVEYMCTDGAPPQAVDKVLHCATQAAGNSVPAAVWSVYFAWYAADAYSAAAEGLLGYAHDTAQPHADTANGILCDQVWSFFCGVPITVPEHAPIGDPVGEPPFVIQSM